MDFLGRLLGSTGTPGPSSDYWYQPVGTMTAAGVKLDAEGAKKVSAWFRGREILATTLAMLPLDVYEKLPNDEGRDTAYRHPLYDVIHRKPNPWQDSFRWRRQAMYHLIDHGNSYHWIKGGARGFVHELWPIADPTNVTPQLTSSGAKVFRVRDPKTNTTTTHTQDEIFHLCGMSDDGVVGKGILDYARESLGLHVVTERFAGRVFSKGSLSAGAIKVPGLLNKEASERMAASFKTADENWHLPKVLEQGSEWIPGQGMTPENAQMLLSRKFGIDEMARWLGVPPHMLASLDRSTNNNIEHQGQEFLDYTEGQWLGLWEAAVNDQLIARPDKFYAEFNRNALVRGDIATRWAAYVDAISTGTYTRNEVRVMENKKKLDGLDEPLDPAHLTGKQPAKASGPPAKTSPQDKQAAQLKAIAVASAGRVLRKEITRVQHLAVKYAADQDAYAVAVTDFYQAHAETVVQAMQMSPEQAGEYCANQAAQLLGELGIRALDNWALPYYAEGLSAWALEEIAA